MEAKEWYSKHNCDHAHCPEDCEHPQPFMVNEDLICGRCWCKYKVYSKMVPCVPDICEDENYV